MSFFSRMNNAFKFERFKGGGFFHLEIIEIDNTYVTFTKKNIFSKIFTLAIQKSYITKVELYNKFYGTNIFIKSNSNNNIIAKGFSKSNAVRIKNLIET